MTANTKADVIVVGLGAMGSATCFQLAARGVSVIGIDRYAPPHPFGSTHGDTRVTRLAIGEGAEYVPLVSRSHAIWRELEEQTGERLLTQAGGLIMAPPGSPFLAETRACARVYEIEHEDLAADEIRARFPMFAVPDDAEAYYEPEAGYVRPEAGVWAQLKLARQHGGELRLNETALEWTASPSTVTVRTDDARYDAEQLVLCAGAWIPELFPEGRDVFAIHRQLTFWFEIRERYEELREMPIFVWELGGEQDGFVHLFGFYGLPALDGPDGGVKVAAESYAETTEPDGRQHPATQAETELIYDGYVKARLPWLGPQPVRTISCLYTATRGSRFVIDRHPEHERVLIVSPCSGHGFKHSPAIGEAVAQWIVNGAPAVDLSPFSFARARRG
jgi:sarcosine oxidase